MTPKLPIPKGWHRVRTGAYVRDGDQQWLGVGHHQCWEITDPKGAWVVINNYFEGDKVFGDEVIIRKNKE